MARDPDRQSLLSENDLYLFNEGSHFRLYEHLGAHPLDDGGTAFAVWAPNARAVSVIGDFNGWDAKRDALRPRGQSGIWEGIVPDASRGSRYKFHIVSHRGGYVVDKTDPFGVTCEIPPKTASIVWDTDYAWADATWMATRARNNALDAAWSIYEVHLGSWARVPEEGGRMLTYRELAPRLGAYAREMGFTHVELLPVMEHPFYGSWGYQSTGYFAPTSRYGSPQDLMAFIDTLHGMGIGVILDWVPSHFATDEHGLGYFDGTHLYEHADPRQGLHPDWNSYIFNYGRSEVRSFLVSSALSWLDRYHVDALRVDAVASMLYLDYGRKEGEWIPNAQGGRENLEAIGFLRRLNEEVYRAFPDTQVIAEESTAWPMVSRPTSAGGLGFGMKWDMGFMHDILHYMSEDPINRAYHHNDLTFRLLYAFQENFVLPFSHDEVVHGKGSLLRKMPGDGPQKFANLRLLLGYMTAQPGKTLLFMGGEFGQWREWSHEDSLDWHLCQYAPHAGLKRWVADLNRLCRDEPALHERDFDVAGFEWIDCSDAAASVISFLRKAATSDDPILVVCNFTPVPRRDYPIGVPRGGTWRVLLNSDAQAYGGSAAPCGPVVEAGSVPRHGRAFSLVLSLPPLSILYLKGMG